MEPQWPRVVDHVRDAVADSSLHLTRNPEPMTGGWSRRVWKLDLNGDAGSRQVLVRCLGYGKTSLRDEYATLAWLRAQGLPAPQPVRLVDDPDDCGVPLLIVAWIPGETMAAQIEGRGWSPNLDEATSIGKALASLHAESPGDFPIAVRDANHMDTIEAGLASFGAMRLDRVRRWVEGIDPPGPRRVVCHLDLYPGNVILGAHGPVTIDWEKAGPDHPMFDVATSQVLVEESLAMGWYPPLPDGSRTLFGQVLFDAYRALHPVEAHAHSFFRAVAACKRLIEVIEWLTKPELTPVQRTNLDAIRDIHFAIIDTEVGRTRPAIS